MLSSKSYFYVFIDLFRDCSRIQHSTAGYKILKGGHAWSHVDFSSHNRHYVI